MIILSLGVAVFAFVLGAYLWVRVPRTEGGIAVLVCAVAAWGLVIFSLGLPRPANHDILASGEQQLIAHVLDEPNAIYLWVQGSSGPVSYSLPWNLEHAKQLRSAKRKGDAQGTPVFVQRKNYGEWAFHSPPPSEPPEKP